MRTSPAIVIHSGYMTGLEDHGAIGEFSNFTARIVNSHMRLSLISIRSPMPTTCLKKSQTS